MYFLPEGYKRQTPKYDGPRDLKSSQIEAQWPVYELAANLSSEYEAVVDVGCGGAVKTKHFFGNIRQVHLIDRPEILQHVRWRGPNVRTHAWNMEGLPDQGEHVESALVFGKRLVICADVIEHLVDPSFLLHYLGAALSISDTTLVISTPDRNLTGRPLGPPKCARHAQEWTVDEFRRLLESAGLTGGTCLSLPGSRFQNELLAQCWIFVP